MNLHAFHMISWTPGPFHQGYRTYFGTQSWPVFAVTTAGSFEPALGTFIGLWSDELQRALQEGGQKSLGEIQALAEAKYWADNAGIKASWPVEELLRLFFFAIAASYLADKAKATSACKTHDLKFFMHA